MKKLISVLLVVTCAVGCVSTERAVAPKANPIRVGVYVGAGALDHVDVLVLPAGREVLYGKKMSSQTKAFFKAFADRGGRVCAVGAGVRYAPQPAIACANHDELVAKLKDARP